VRLRPPTPQDAEAVLALIVARDVADYGAPDYTLADLREEWASGEVDLERDAVVVEEDGALVAYGLVRAQGAFVTVPPEHEGRGIGTQLLRWAEAHGRRRQWVAERNAAGHALLAQAGYEPVRHYWRMELALAAPVSAPVLPDGIELRALRPHSDAEALHAISEAAFSANRDYEPESLDAFREEHLEAHDLDPALSLVAERNGRPVGFLLARRWEEGDGYVDLLAVHPDASGRRLGETLLRTAFAGFAAAGLGSAQLGVASDNPRALRLYQRAGMTQRFRVDVLEYKTDDATAMHAGTIA
jgi:mycothiol synthase